MSIFNRLELKGIWHTGYRPTEADYANLFDSTYLKSDDEKLIVQQVTGSGTVVLTATANEVGGYPKLIGGLDESNATVPVIPSTLIPYNIDKNIKINGFLYVYGGATPNYIYGTTNIPVLSSTNLTTTNITNTQDITTGRLLATTINSTGITATTVSANTYQGEFTGNAWTASKLETARSIAISGDATYSTTFDGSTNVSSALTLSNVFTAGQGSYQYNSFVVNSKGLITTATSAEYLIPSSPSLNLRTVTNNGATADVPIVIKDTTDSTTTTTGSLVVSGGIGIKKALTVGSNILQVATNNKTNTVVGSISVATTSPTSIDSFSGIDYRSAKYFLQITQGSSTINYHISELLLLNDGVSAHTSEYAILTSSGVLGTFTADISSNTVTLYVTMNSNTSAIVNFQRTSMAVTNP